MNNEHPAGSGSDDDRPEKTTAPTGPDRPEDDFEAGTNREGNWLNDLDLSEARADQPSLDAGHVRGEDHAEDVSSAAPIRGGVRDEGDAATGSAGTTRGSIADADGGGEPTGHAETRRGGVAHLSEPETETEEVTDWVSDPEPIAPLVVEPRIEERSRPIVPAAPAPGKRWLAIAAGVMIVCLGSGLTYFWNDSRQAGQRAADAKEQADKLASANAKADSARAQEIQQSKASAEIARKTMQDEADEKVAQEIKKADAARAQEIQQSKASAEIARKTMQDEADAKVAMAASTAAAEVKSAREAAAAKVKAAEAAAARIVVDRSPGGLVRYADSLADTPTKAAQLYHQAAQMLVDSRKADEALPLLEKARTLAIKAKDVAAQTRALDLLATVHAGAGRLDDAIKACEQGAAIEGIEDSAREEFVNLAESLRSKQRRSSPGKAGTPGGSARLRSSLALLLVGVQAPPAVPQLPPDIDERLRKARQVDETPAKKTPAASLRLASIELEAGDFFAKAKRPDLAKPHYESAVETANAGIKLCGLSLGKGDGSSRIALLLGELVEVGGKANEELRALPVPSSDLAGRLKRAETDRDGLRAAALAIDADFKDAEDPKIWASRMVERSRVGEEARAALLRAAQAFDPSVRETGGPKAWAGAIAGQAAKVDGLSKSEARLASLVEAIAAMEDASGDRLLKDSPPTVDRRVAPDATEAVAWNRRVADSVAGVIARKKASEAGFKEGRRLWSVEASRLAEIVGFTPPSPPGLDTDYHAASSGPWREALIARVRERAGTGSEVSANASLHDELSASAHCAEGLRLYQAGRPVEAGARFAEASRLMPRAPRYAYFFALAQRAAGNTAEADSAARRGFALEQANGSGPSIVDTALERVQFEPRNWIESYRRTGHPPAPAPSGPRGY